MESNTIGYTTWGNVRGGCGHIHETLEEGVVCLERDQHWISSMSDGLRPDRWIYSLVLYPGDEITRRPLSSAEMAMLPRIRV